jgi:hypothetical protein
MSVGNRELKLGPLLRAIGIPGDQCHLGGKRRRGKSAAFNVRGETVAKKAMFNLTQIKMRRFQRYMISRAIISVGG